MSSERTDTDKEGIDTAQEAMNRYLGSMEVDEDRTIGVEDFRSLMHAIQAEFNMGKEKHRGSIEGEEEKFTYFCKDSDCVVTRVE